MNKFLFPKSLLFCSFENFYVALEMIIRKRKECKGGHCVFIYRTNECYGENICIKSWMHDKNLTLKSWMHDEYLYQ